MQQKQT